MSKRLNLRGQRFGRLVAVRIDKIVRPRGRTYWNCRCDCGEHKVICVDKLTSGNTRSCGCLRRDIGYTKNLTHGHTSRLNYEKCYSSVYAIWRNMRRRCEDEKDSHYSNYGGRGIRVCARWKNFDNFIRDMGVPPPDMTLDRINNDGNYRKSNCRWADKFTQANNKRNTVRATYRGNTYALRDLARMLDIPFANLYHHVVLKKRSVAKALLCMGARP